MQHSRLHAIEPIQTLRILIVKISSLGDIVHCLPVLDDIARHLPHAQVDWVVEEAFAALPLAHPGVSRVLPVAQRRWRKSLLSANVRQERATHRSHLAQETYDAVIDAQGLLKSAWLARQAMLTPHGQRHGHAHPRERLAMLAYRHRHQVSWEHHAATRNRLLVAHALGYRLNDSELAAPCYGLPKPAREGSVPSAPYAMLLHGTSLAAKEWPETHWLALAQALTARGLRCVFPAGNVAEEARAVKLCEQCPGAIALPRGSVTALLPFLAHAHCAIGVDTGLMHLAAAFDVPTVAIFRASDPRHNGVFAARARNVVSLAPDAAQAVVPVLAALDALLGAEQTA